MYLQNALTVPIVIVVWTNCCHDICNDHGSNNSLKQHNNNFNQNNPDCYLRNGLKQSCFEKGITLSRNHLLLKEIYLWYTFHWHPRLLNASARDRDVEQKKKWKEREGGGEREREGSSYNFK